jgi:hypothetical protein
MGSVAAPAPVLPIAGVLAASPALLADAQRALAAAVAPIAAVSAAAPWAYSTYYRDEMGAELWRQYLAFAVWMEPEELADLKRLTNALEDDWRGPRGRAVNIDPGYLDLVRVVLASTKDAAHRVAIDRGLYAEAALHFVGGRFEPWPYTYPDYADAAAIEFFTQVRDRFRAERVLKAHTWDGRRRWRCSPRLRDADASPGGRSNAG